MAQFNINRNADDTFYRYKMPALKTKVEGRGNGIKTVIDNCVAVATALQRPAEYVCKHFGFELGAQCQMNAKTERYIVNGSHEASTLQDKLDVFIKNWVLCQSCENPETSIKVKDGIINSSCKACGWRGELKAVGRMGQYVLKNPPEKFTVGEKGMYEKSGRKESDDKDQAQKTSPKRKVDGWEDDAEFAMATDDAARMDRALKNIENLMGGLSLGVEEIVENMTMDKKYELFVKHCKRIKKEKGDDFAENCAAEVNCLRDTLQLMDGQAVWAYCSALMKWTDEEKKISEKKFMENLKKFSEHLKVLCDIDHEDGEKSQKMMLGVVETVVYNNKKKCLPYTAHILKQLYDDDILEDTSIIKWAEKPTKKFVKKSFVEKMIENCEKLVAWMKEADSSDEESSSEEESESENEAGEQQSKVAEKQQEEASSKEESEAKTPEAEEAPKPKPAAAAKVNTLLDDDDSDDDIDIDDI